MSKEELRSKLPGLQDSKLFNLMFNQMIKDKEIVAEEKYSPSGFTHGFPGR